MYEAICRTDIYIHPWGKIWGLDVRELWGKEKGNEQATLEGYPISLIRTIGVWYIATIISIFYFISKDYFFGNQRGKKNLFQAIFFYLYV